MVVKVMISIYRTEESMKKNKSELDFRHSIKKQKNKILRNWIILLGLLFFSPFYLSIIRKFVETGIILPKYESVFFIVYGVLFILSVVLFLSVRCPNCNRSIYGVYVGKILIGCKLWISKHCYCGARLK